MLSLIITLTVAGIVLLAVEVVVPGMVVGALGVASLLGAIILSYSHFGFAGGNLMAIGIVGSTFAGFMVWLHMMPRTAIGRRIMLTSQSEGGKTGAGSDTLLGKRGVAATQLRPSGTAVIEGKRVDVVAESGFIEADEPVVVRAVEGMRVVVRKSPA